MTDVAAADRGFVQIASKHSVTATMDRLEALLKERGILVFCRIDFSGDAQRAGLSMRPEQLLIFGNPRAGTPLMIAAPTVGLDLPLKVLAWEDATGQTRVAYNTATYITQRHHLAAAMSANLDTVLPIIGRAAGD
jgi:uncharacterized protein (DUF302 family)